MSTENHKRISMLQKHDDTVADLLRTPPDEWNVICSSDPRSSRRIHENADRLPGCAKVLERVIQNPVIMASPVLLGVPSGSLL
jgi:hypothetical protein